MNEDFYTDHPSDSESSSIDQTPIEATGRQVNDTPIADEQPVYQENMGQNAYRQHTPYTPYAPQVHTAPVVNGAPPIMQPPRKKKSRAGVIIACILAICMMFGGVGIALAFQDKGDNGGTTNSGNNDTNSGNSAQLDIKNSPTASDTKDNSEELSVVGLVNKVEASCVGITVKTTSTTNGLYGNLGESTSTGEGSGVLILEDASKGLTYVVTCAHVIDTAGSSFTVTLDDGTEYEGTLVGYDAQTDIGVLSIQATGLTIAEFGDSDALQKGQSVIAIGNPGGSAYANSVTEGIVSAIDRPVQSSIGYKTNCIQHTAPINPGNSGGALFNMYGQVIGINSSKISSTEYEGMGFAVPSQTAKEVVNSLIARGYVAGRAQLGIKYNSLSNYQNYAQLVASGISEGAIVIASINEESAFNGTDVQQYDIITGVNGTKMTSTDILTSALSNASPGDTMALEMARVENGRLNTYTVTVTLIESKG